MATPAVITKLAAVSLLSTLPIAIPKGAFPEGFLANSGNGEGAILSIDSPATSGWGIGASSAIGFELNVTGDGHWTVLVWLLSIGRDRPCYLTEEAVRMLHSRQEGQWLVAHRSPATETEGGI
jgi:hypothetical protein